MLLQPIVGLETHSATPLIDEVSIMQIPRGGGKFSLCLAIGMTLVCCYSRADQQVSEPTTPPNAASVTKERQAVAESGPAEQVIWAGSVAQRQIRWTNRDIYVDDQKLLSPYVQREFEVFVSDLKKDIRPGEQMMACDYNLYFSIVSIVGPLATLEERYGIVCGKPSVGERFTMVNLENRQRPQADKLFDDSSALTDRVRLSDYFEERTILEALLSAPLIREALKNEEAQTDPKTLAEVSSFFEEHPAAIRSKGSFFTLPSDFLSGFAFDHLDNNLVSVRMSLQPASEAERGLHVELELLLPIPKSLEQALRLAESRQEGFLMKDAEQVGGNKITTFNFKTPT